MAVFWPFQELSILKLHLTKSKVSDTISFQELAWENALINGIKQMIFHPLQIRGLWSDRKEFCAAALLVQFYKHVQNSLRKCLGKMIKKRELSVFSVTVLETILPNFWASNGALRINFYLKMSLNSLNIHLMASVWLNWTFHKSKLILTWRLVMPRSSLTMELKWFQFKVDNKSAR